MAERDTHTGPPRVVRVDPAQPDGAVLAAAGRLIREGRLVAFPTETVYGLGANALDELAVGRIYAAKGRAASDPLIVHLGGREWLTEVVTALAPADQAPGGEASIVEALAAHFWPGPLTIVLPKSHRIPDRVTAGLSTVAVRVPRHPVAQGLLHAAGVPIAAPSANTFMRTSATAAPHVVDDLGDRVDLVLDAGPTPIGIESTVIQVLPGQVRLLRPGAVSVEAMEGVLRQAGLPAAVVTVRPAATNGRPAAPGQMEKHYAPRARFQLFRGPGVTARQAIREAVSAALQRGERVGLLLCREDLQALSGLATPASKQPSGHLQIEDLGPQADLAGIGRRLFAAMRRLDARGVDTIFARSLPTAGLGLAIDDRLTRAAGGRVVRVGEPAGEPD